MTSEAEVNLPDRLERLGARIKGLEEQLAESEGQMATAKARWVEVVVNLCIALAEMRAEFDSNQAFGRWYEESGLTLNAMDRAAAIAMGQHIEQVRPVLEQTTRSSLQLIHRHECRFISANKTIANSSAAAPPAKPRRGRLPRNREGTKIGDALDALRKAGPAGMTREELIQAGDLQGGAGLQRNVVYGEAAQSPDGGHFWAREHAPVGALVVEPLKDPELPPLSLTAQQKLDMHRERLEREFAARVEVESRRRSLEWLETERIPNLEKKIADLTRMLNWPRNAVMTKAEFNKLVMVCHPDAIISRTPEQLSDAFQILQKYKLKMVDDEEEKAELIRKMRSMLPQSTAEMMARKKPAASQPSL